MDQEQSQAQEARQLRIRAEQVRYVYESFNTALFGTFLGAVLLLALQWEYVNQDYMLAWMSIFVLINLMRGIVVSRFNGLRLPDDECVKWGRLFLTGSLAAGIIWAAGAVIAFPWGNLSYQLTTTIIIVGLSAGAVSTISVLFSSFAVFVSPMMVTLMVLFAIEKQYLITIVLFFTLLFIFRGARKITLSFEQNIILQVEADEREKWLVQARNEADQANKAKSQFLANMSHELRTPLHGILGFAQLATTKLESVGNEQSHSYLSKIQSSGERLKVLLDGLLDLSRLEAGQMRMNYQESTVKDIVDSCLSEQSAVVGDRKLSVNYEADAEHLVEMDAARIRQVVSNLLANAIKFSPEGGQIRIRTTFLRFAGSERETQDRVQVSICDEGRGIPVKELEKIFGKFIQSSTNVVSDGGTGLGLAITREIIEAHSGRVWAENVEPNGARFVFEIPLKQLTQ